MMTSSFHFPHFKSLSIWLTNECNSLKALSNPNNFILVKTLYPYFHINGGSHDEFN